MPNRMLRNWVGSDKVDMLSVHAERFFTRLIMIVDDYGRYYADVRLLKPALFPLKVDSIREADLTRWLDECKTAGLIVVYEISKKWYLQIEEFNQRLRQKNERFPAPKKHDGQMSDNSPSDDGAKRREEEMKGREQDTPIGNQFRQPSIPTKQQVWEYFSGQGATKEMAKSFYSKYEATGWYLNGSPVVNWSALAGRFIENWKGSDYNEQSTAAPLKHGI